MRQRYLVTYDIRDPRRLRLVFKAMKGFGRHMQYSVFVCDLTPVRRIALESRILDLIDAGDDSVLVVDLGPTEGRGRSCISAIGQPYREPDNGPRVL